MAYEHGMGPGREGAAASAIPGRGVLEGIKMTPGRPGGTGGTGLRAGAWGPRGPGARQARRAR